MILFLNVCNAEGREKDRQINILFCMTDKTFIYGKRGMVFVLYVTSCVVKNWFSGLFPVHFAEFCFLAVFLFCRCGFPPLVIILASLTLPSFNGSPPCARKPVCSPAVGFSFPHHTCLPPKFELLLEAPKCRCLFSFYSFPLLDKAEISLPLSKSGIIHILAQ